MHPDQPDRRHPIEVRGYSIRFVYLEADSDFYLPGDPVFLEALLESGPSFEGPFHCVVTRPDGETFDLPVVIYPFEEGYNFVETSGTMDTDQAGEHEILCSVYLDA